MLIGSCCPSCRAGAPRGRNCTTCGRWVPAFGLACLTCGATFEGVHLDGPRFAEVRPVQPLTRADLAAYDDKARALVRNVGRFFECFGQGSVPRSTTRVPRDSSKAVAGHLAALGLTVQRIEQLHAGGKSQTPERWRATCTRDGAEVVITSCDRLSLCARTGVRLEGLTAFALPVEIKRRPRRASAEASA
jgi:hypothetical protein